MSEKMEIVSDWVGSIREDVETVKKLVEADQVDDDARRFAAAALNYLVSRMDLIPDWTDTIGVVDDVLVLRTCIGLANAYGLADNTPDDVIIDVGRLSNEAERVEFVLGDDLNSKLRKYCARLVEETVRGRSVDSLLKSKEQRDKLYEEIDEDLMRIPAASFADGESVELKLISYLTAKLKDV